MTPAEHDLIPLLARPLRAPSPGVDLARSVIYHASATPTGDYMKGWHKGQACAYGRMLYQWLNEVGLWREGHRVPVDVEGYVELAREVCGADDSDMPT